jgi:hypothetical protein
MLGFTSAVLGANDGQQPQTPSSHAAPPPPSRRHAFAAPSLDALAAEQFPRGCQPRGRLVAGQLQARPSVHARLGS